MTKTSQKPAPGFGEFAPRIDAFLKEHLFADVFESDVLTYQQRELVTISALAAMPNVASQLKSHVQIGINTGITEGQLASIADLLQIHINLVQANILRRIIGKPIVEVANTDLMVRIADIQILPEFLEEYKSILKVAATTSLKVEPGVIAIFPIYQTEDSTNIKIVEVYASKAAYVSHLKTPHFILYKTSTSALVKY